MRAILTLLLVLIAAPVFATDDRNRDFDFEFGAWTAHISRLVAPLSGSTEWVDYTGTSVVKPLWGGRANIGELLVAGPSGQIEGMSLRVFDPASGQWRIHWTNARDGMVGEAMVGGFSEGRGLFYNTEEFQGRPVTVRFIFSDITKSSFGLEQAFSIDDGETWEPNWIARFERGLPSDTGGVGHAAAVALWEAIDNAWNGRDARRFSTLFSEDALMVFHDREQVLAGQDAIQEEFTQRFPAIAAPYEHRSEVERVRAVAHGVLVVDGTVEVLRDAGPEAPAPELFRSFRVLSVLVREEGEWRFREMRIHLVP